MSDLLDVTIVFPCLNEERTLARCIDEANDYLVRSGFQGEIVVADNGSSDRSIKIAEELGARLVPAAPQGYGTAVRAGINAARGTIVVIADADLSYDLSETGRLLDAIKSGCELVIGDRFKGDIKAGAMPFLHRYLGTPALSLITATAFGAPLLDSQSGFRAFRKEAIQKLQLSSHGMELATEMIAKASLEKLRINRVPVTYRIDGRGKVSHLRPLRDGLRHLRLVIQIAATRLLFRK